MFGRMGHWWHDAASGPTVAGAVCTLLQTAWSISHIADAANMRFVLSIILSLFLFRILLFFCKLLTFDSVLLRGID
jgi:hypothetical protein